MKENIFTRNPGGKIAALLVCAAMYGITYIICEEFLFNVYVFEWMAHNNYVYTWIFPLLMIILDKTPVAYFASAGNLIGMFVGQYLGDFIQLQRMKQITPGMEETNPGLYWSLNTHYGVFIWGITFLICIGIGIAVTVIMNVKRKRRGLNELSTA